MDDHKRTVAGLFGRAAAGYDQVGFFHQVAQRLLVLAGVDQGMRVLDVACGTGAVLVQAARLVGPTGLASGSTWPSQWSPWPLGGYSNRARTKPRSR